MKKRTDDSQRTSRRRFTKAVAAALAAAPLASCAQSGNQGQNSNQANANQPAANQNSASPTGQEKQLTLRSDHEPPTIFGDSMNLELDQLLRNISDGTDPDRPPKRQIVVTDGLHQYRTIQRVYVYTEFKDLPVVDPFDFVAADEAQLRLWLRDAKSNPDNGYEPIASTDKPDFIISGNHDDGGNKTILIESKRYLDHVKKTAKRHRRNRHEHKHNNRDFRIAKWDIAKPNGTILNAGNDSNVSVSGRGYAHRYIFMIVCEE